MSDHIQQKIIEDSRLRKIFTPSDFKKYYASNDQGKQAFESLTGRGYFHKGTVKDTGSKVYISTQYVDKITDFTEGLKMNDVHPDLFICPERGEDKYVDIDTCEGACGTGCKYIKSCDSYINKKKEELIP